MPSPNVTCGTVFKPRVKTQSRRLLAPPIVQLKLGCDTALLREIQHACTGQSATVRHQSQEVLYISEMRLSPDRPIQSQSAVFRPLTIHAKSKPMLSSKPGSRYPKPGSRALHQLAIHAKSKPMLTSKSGSRYPKPRVKTQGQSQ